MAIRSDQYHRAALARLGDAQCLYDSRHWSGAVYLAGRAVEAILRALILKRGGRIDGGHDLKHHLKSARRLGMLTDDEARGGGRINDHMNALAIIWKNDRRYHDDDKLLSVIRHARLYRGTKGDPLKACAFEMLESSEALVSRGERAWSKK